MTISRRGLLFGLPLFIWQHCWRVHTTVRCRASVSEWRWVIKARAMGMRRLRIVMADRYIIRCLG